MKRIGLFAFLILPLFGCPVGFGPDLTPPVIHAVTVTPTVVRVWDTVTFHVDATDNRSDITFEFDFDNDGLYESDENTYVWGFAGTFQVNVRAVDRAGNISEPHAVILNVIA
jgi:hypothetical protein